MASTKKNILVFFTDQQRTDTLGFRNPMCKTPNFDRIFENGISFDRCVTPSPLCAPARTSVFTGLYPHQVPGICPPKGTMTVNDEISESDTTMMTNDYTAAITPVLPRLLEQAGYQISYAGKWHLGNDCIRDWFPNSCGYSTKEYSLWCKESGFQDGWAFNDPAVRSKRPPHMSIPVPARMKLAPENHGDAWITTKAIEHIRDRDPEKPFFTVCALNGPHPPFKIPEPYLSTYTEIADQIPCPENFKARAGEPNYEKDNYYRHLAEDYSTDWKDWQKSVAAYWGLVKLLDDQMGRLWRCLEEEKLLENTVVILISDHGEMLGSHGLWHKMECFEEALRVPMVVAYPGVPGGRHSQSQVSLLDFVPTVLELAGATFDHRQFEGESLYGEITGTDTIDADRKLYSEQRPLGVFHHAKDWRAVIDQNYKYVWTLDDREQFYDMHTDRQEIHNLADTAEPALLQQYRDSLCSWAEQKKDPLAAKIKASLQS